VVRLYVFRQDILLSWISGSLFDRVFWNQIHAQIVSHQEERFTQAEMNLLSRIIIIAVVAWVTGCAIFGLDLIPTLTGIVVIALIRPVYERVRKE
jgi:uncharacterized membrane protein